MSRTLNCSIIKNPWCPTCYDQRDVSIGYLDINGCKVTERVDCPDCEYPPMFVLNLDKFGGLSKEIIGPEQAKLILLEDDNET